LQVLIGPDRDSIRIEGGVSPACFPTLREQMGRRVGFGEIGTDAACRHSQQTEDQESACCFVDLFPPLILSIYHRPRSGQFLTLQLSDPLGTNVGAEAERD
jgi:hypothetical protein